jgi:formimidoylglutamate deiminase
VPVLHGARALTPEGWKSDVRVTIDRGAIATVETEASAQEGDERHAIIAPAPANLHSHAFQRAMAGLAEVRGQGDDTFWTWRETMYRFALMMSPDDVEAVAAQLYVEMLEAGFAAVAEFHYLHNAPDGSPYAEPAEMAGRILSAARRVGIGMTLLPVFYAHSTFGGAPPRPEQRRFINDVPSFARLVDDCREMVKVDEGEAIGIAPHSLRAVTPSELSELMSVVGDGPIHIHAAEQVARSGAVAGLCPITEANLGDGVFNATDYIRAGGRYGVGTDSNVSIGVAAELRQLEYAQRLRERARNVYAPPGASCGRTMLEAIWVGGAQAMRRKSGRLAPGAAADILTFRADHPTLAGKADDQVLDAWIFSAGNPLVDCVWSGGLKVVAGGRHVFRDEIAEQFAKTMRELS